jgi:hypothetical protein
MSYEQVPAGTDFAFDLGERILAKQSTRVDSLDTKAAVVMGVNGVLAGILPEQLFGPAAGWFSFVAGSSLFLSLVAALVSFWTGKYATAPEFGSILRRIEAPEVWLKWRFLPNLENAISTNHIKLERKAFLLTLSLTGLLVLITTVGGYLIYANYPAGVG